MKLGTVPMGRSFGGEGIWIVGLAIVLAAGLGSACRVSSGFEVTTRPPDFGYVPPERIQSSMWVLAAEIHQLDELLTAPVDERSPELKRKVAWSLERMSVAARQLDTPGRSTPAHPVLSDHLEEFVQRLERARRAVERTPPDYFQASALAGGCYLCHGTGRASLRQDQEGSG
ncbi:MAG: hypothetical protein JRF61_12335 [Deltaproteobacteria bacterium]|jgi:hypothetical protein|nr:hypothetical protein [Deltaproteobacteria bacterium]